MKILAIFFIISDYINIPESIKRKYESGNIGNAHFSDIIRMMILAKYGGIWLDATIFLHGPIDENAFSQLFYSLGFQSEKGKYVSEHKWLVGVIGGCKDSKFLANISVSLNNYWIRHSVPIDYFVFDYIIAALYYHNSDFHSLVDSLPRMEFFTGELRKIINKEYSENDLNRLLKNNQIYTLTYRQGYRKYTLDGKLTNYGYLTQKYLGNEAKGVD